MPRILIIDDEELVRTMLKDALGRAGYEVVEAPNGREGVQLHRAAPVDLVITDIFMPEKEGLETITHLTLHNPNLKIFAISGGQSRWGNIDALEIARRFGAHRTFSKPLELETILKAVAHALPKNPRANT